MIKTNGSTAEILKQKTPRVIHNSGIWCYVGWVDSDVSKNYHASIFRDMWFKK